MAQRESPHPDTDNLDTTGGEGRAQGEREVEKAQDRQGRSLGKPKVPAYSDDVEDEVHLRETDLQEHLERMMPKDAETMSTRLPEVSGSEFPARSAVIAETAPLDAASIGGIHDQPVRQRPAFDGEEEHHAGEEDACLCEGRDPPDLPKGA